MCGEVAVEEFVLVLLLLLLLELLLLLLLFVVLLDVISEFVVRGGDLLTFLVLGVFSPDDVCCFCCCRHLARRFLNQTYDKE